MADSGGPAYVIIHNIRKTIGKTLGRANLLPAGTLCVIVRQEEQGYLVGE